jgi:pimeloyl-ACP methyl ester carboxylesterase
MATTAEPLEVTGESVITLADGRALAFTQGGDLTSRRVFVALHGVFGVGQQSDSSGLLQLFASRGFRSVSPTLPGWGRSSPYPAGRPLCAYASDIRELL